MSEATWYVKVECLVIGPNEGPIRQKIEYDATTKEVAQTIQNELGSYFIDKNKIITASDAA